jgi:DNA-binding response OmpR family regulator
MRVLVVEDRRQTAAFIRKALQAEGFAVDVLHGRRRGADGGRADSLRRRHP